MLHHVDDSTFEAQVLRSPGTILVEFFTPSCGPCRQLEPHLQKIANQFEGRIKVVKINSDTSIQTSQRYGVYVAPTFFLFRNGQILQTIHGAPPPNRLFALVQAFA